MSEALNLESRIATLFLEKLHLEIPSVETELLDTGMVDSMAFVDLLYHLEQEFGITVSFDDLEIDNFRSIEKISKYVATRNGANSALEAVQKGGGVRRNDGH
jgi:acyl carrier protein